MVLIAQGEICRQCGEPLRETEAVLMLGKGVYCGPECQEAAEVREELTAAREVMCDNCTGVGHVPEDVDPGHPSARTCSVCGGAGFRWVES